MLHAAGIFPRSWQGKERSFHHINCSLVPQNNKESTNKKRSYEKKPMNIVHALLGLSHTHKKTMYNGKETSPHIHTLGYWQTFFEHSPCLVFEPHQSTSWSSITQWSLAGHSISPFTASHFQKHLPTWKCSSSELRGHVYIYITLVQSHWGYIATYC